MARKPAKNIKNFIALTPLEQMELRMLDAQRLLASANLQAAEALLKNRAHEVAGSHGVDLSKEAPGSWDLRISEGVIQRAKT